MSSILFVKYIRISTAKGISTSSVVQRTKGAIFSPGGGIRSKKDIEEEIKCAREGKWPEEDPFTYTLLGRKSQKPMEYWFHYTDRKAGKGYSDFTTNVYSGRPHMWPGQQQVGPWVWTLTTLILFAMIIDFNWFWHNGRALYLKYKKTDAATLDKFEEKEDGIGDPLAQTSQNQSFASKNGNVQPSADEQEAINCSIYDSALLNKKKKSIGFRERRIINYEDRIRAYSSPDKIFRYFATIKLQYEDGSFDIFMTPEDFVRSLTPGVMQPRKYGLDSYKLFNANKVRFNYSSDQESVFSWLGKSGGLINFGDYLFMMTLLATSSSEFKLAFHVFDLNGDGELDQQEFERVQELVLSQSNVGQRHRDHTTGTGSFVKSSKNSAVIKHFFGWDGKRKLNIDTFLKFQQDLHRDILRIEFERRDPESGPEGIISEISFAELLLIHSNLPEKRQKRMIKRVRKKYGKDVADKKGISFAEVNDFFAFIYHIDKVDLALHFYKLAGKSLSKELLQRVARKVTGVQLSDTVVEVVVTLFDENADGELSQREFIAIMKKRMQRGLERPKDTGLVRFADAIWQCGKEQLGLMVTRENRRER